MDAVPRVDANEPAVTGGEHKEKLQQWADGETGYPWIDAIMTQLR